MALLTLRDVSIGFGGQPLLDSVTLNIEQGERACIIGRNGAGKSTLLRIMAGEEQPDAGEVIVRAGARVSYLPQDVPTGIRGQVRAIVESARRPHAETQDWEHAGRATEIMSRLDIDPEAPFETLSGGLKRRALLARALVENPDVLLLDEPTNHLDIDSIAWLEGFLDRQVGTFLFVTHDRAFLRKLADRIIDLDRGAVADWSCDYDTFLLRKQRLLDGEAAIWERKTRKLTKEEVWIRQGIKARRTRDEGRVRALEALRKEFSGRRLQPGVASFSLPPVERSGEWVIEAKALEFRYPTPEPRAPPLIAGLNLRVIRGERLGVIGPNGCGKTSLLKVLTGELPHSGGSLRMGARLSVSHFDQLRGGLDANRTVAQNLADESDTVPVGNTRRNVFGYLQEFLFSSDRARTPVSALSGGEKSRLLLARLFMQPGNLMVMDEPTNDLDIETLELLEEQLQQYSGTLLVVSHDRAFLDRTVTGTLVFEGNGRIEQHAGGFSDIPARPPPARTRSVDNGRESAKPESATRSGVRFGFRERFELENIGERIEQLEAEVDACRLQVAAPDFFRKSPADQQLETQRLLELEAEAEAMIERWAQLEALKTEGGRT